MKKNLVLLGMMGVGKTTLGKIVAKKQGFKFVDIDLNIEKNNAMKISDIFKKKGEKFFRAKEEDEVLKSMEKNKCVIALGGGAFINKTIRGIILKNAISIWLDTNLKTINKRVKWNNKRPLLAGEDKSTIISNLYTERKNIYKLADHRINCDSLSKLSIVKKIITIYESQ